MPGAQIAALFPAAVAAAELRTAGDAASLLQAEKLGLERAATERVQEFAAGRMCARRALAAMGIEHFPLCAGPDRAPIWPTQVVGSITHTRGFCAAVVAQRSRFRGLGLDAEIVDAVQPRLWRSVCSASEWQLLMDLPEWQRPRAAALIFCAKEAFYKCMHSWHARLRFRDVSIDPQSWSSDSGSLRASGPDLLALPGRYQFQGAMLAVGIAWTVAGDQ
jgi:4'-phosphopantetheinyl transferase EntD